jgi:hypothetical protein
VLIDINDAIVKVHGYAEQGAGFGHSGAHFIARDRTAGFLRGCHHTDSPAPTTDRTETDRLVKITELAPRSWSKLDLFSMRQDEVRSPRVL